MTYRGGCHLNCCVKPCKCRRITAEAKSAIVSGEEVHDRVERGTKRGYEKVQPGACSSS